MPLLSKSQKRVVMIVDDEEDQRVELAFAVEQLGYEAICLPTGEEMLGAMMEHSPHMILLDINLPYRDGMRIAELATHLNHRVRICLMSGNADRCTEARHRPTGVFAVLEKPLAVDQLRHILPPYALLDAVSA